MTKKKEQVKEPKKQPEIKPEKKEPIAAPVQYHDKSWRVANGQQEA
jgi:hypothetical protein